MRCIFEKITDLSAEAVVQRTVAATRGVLLKKVFLLKKRLWQRCFPVNFAKFLRTHFLIEHLRWLLTYLQKSFPQSLRPSKETWFLIPGKLSEKPLKKVCDNFLMKRQIVNWHSVTIKNVSFWRGTCSGNF